MLRQERFYLTTVDILKGLAIFSMIFGHGIGWWDLSLMRNYENGSLAIVVIMVLGLMVFPCFLFFSGFNQVNSILRKGVNPSTRFQIRSHSIKRGFFFFLLGVISMFLMFLVKSQGDMRTLLTYLLTWHLLHIFGLSTLFILAILEFAYWIDGKIGLNWKIRHLFTIFLLINLLFVIFFFFLFHNYTISYSREFPVNLDIQSILENIFLDVSSCGVIPWLSFSLAGGLTASFLDLQNLQKEILPKKGFFILFINFLILLIGMLFLQFERFISAGIGYASSFSHVFISIGLIGFFNLFLILIFDVYQYISQERIKKLLYPIITLSKISLTIYFVHPIVGIFNPNIITSELMLLILITIYCLFFILIAIFWQKWKFRYSLEWFMRRLT